MKFLKFLGNFFATIILIVMFFWMLGVGISSVALKIISVNGLTKIINDADFTLLLYDEDGNKTEIYNKLINETGLSEENVESLLESKTLKNLIIDFTNDFLNYYITGDEVYKLTSEKLVMKVEDNIDAVLEEAKINITEEEKDAIVDAVRQESSNITNELYSDEIAIDKTTVFLIDNYVYFVIIIAVIMFLLVALLKWNVIKALKDTGITIVISGVVLLILGLIFNNNFVITSSINEIGSDAFVFQLFNSIVSLFITNSLIMLGIGALLIVISIFIKKLMLKNNKSNSNVIESDTNIESQ